MTHRDNGKAKLLDVKGLRTFFDTRRGPVKSVDGISYYIAPGETVALVGESGCGKTVSALSLLRLVPILAFFNNEFC